MAFRGMKLLLSFYIFPFLFVSLCYFLSHVAVTLYKCVKQASPFIYALFFLILLLFHPILLGPPPPHPTAFQGPIPGVPQPFSAPPKFPSSYGVSVRRALPFAEHLLTMNHFVRAFTHKLSHLPHTHTHTHTHTCTYL